MRGFGNHYASFYEIVHGTGAGGDEGIAGGVSLELIGKGDGAAQLNAT